MAIRLLNVSSVALILCLALPAGAQPEPARDWKEVIGANEEADFAQAAAMTNQIQASIAKQSDGVVRRGFHAKAHAAISGEFRVLDGLPACFRYGIFKEAKSYPVMARFSNGVGEVHSDRRVDLRGFSLKVMGAADPMLLADENGGLTQDFLLINNPKVSARNTEQFMGFAKAALAGGFRLLPILIRELGIEEATRITGYLADAALKSVRSLASEEYWSGGCVKLGPYAIKYAARPRVKVSRFATMFRSGSFLREEFKKRLKQEDVKFDFLVQFYVDEKRTPIEDAAVEWKESVSPFVKVAEITFAKRDLDTPASQAEEARVNALAFNPWHASADMRPLGDIQRVRKQVYAASRNLRLSPGATGKAE